jgi:hypothetical protein
MSTGWDYFCELLPSTGLLFIPHVSQAIYASVESHGGTILTGENLKTRRKRVRLPLCPPEIPPAQTQKICPCATFFRQKSHLDWPGRDPGPPPWEAVDSPPGRSLISWLLIKLFSSYIVKIWPPSIVYYFCPKPSYISDVRTEIGDTEIICL